ncbi:hypothetical protein BJX76DRAFT_315469 [Aspergillus varians]
MHLFSWQILGSLGSLAKTQQYRVQSNAGFRPVRQNMGLSFADRRREFPDYTFHDQHRYTPEQVMGDLVASGRQ